MNHPGSPAQLCPQMMSAPADTGLQPDKIRLQDDTNQSTSQITSQTPGNHDQK